MCENVLQWKKNFKKKIIYYVKEIIIIPRFWIVKLTKVKVRSESNDEDVLANDCDFLNVMWIFLQWKNTLKIKIIYVVKEWNIAAQDIL